MAYSGTDAVFRSAVSVIGSPKFPLAFTTEVRSNRFQKNDNFKKIVQNTVWIQSITV